MDYAEPNVDSGGDEGAHEDKTGNTWDPSWRVEVASQVIRIIISN